jgi:hypothetical protein
MGSGVLITSVFSLNSSYVMHGKEFWVLISWGVEKYSEIAIYLIMVLIYNII